MESRTKSNVRARGCKEGRRRGARYRRGLHVDSHAIVGLVSWALEVPFGLVAVRIGLEGAASNRNQDDDAPFGRTMSLDQSACSLVPRVTCCGWIRSDVNAECDAVVAESYRSVRLFA